ncbi:glycoside hydrolase family 5 protein [Hebeloma cylindrosporum]|uniref:Glycoside hydrolase family 5 protein n=1 Tax=Hebeloma cylindrosporum TaxID=76867 RepID=A0A0C3BT73_HEBCY|nr:glycoside hydrolase family 5 protein [Hebeloma cylindrosporum h7]
MRRNLLLIVLCFEAVLLISGAEAGRQQQCRLHPHENQVLLQPPTNTGVGGVSATANHSPSSPTSSSRSSITMPPNPTSTPSASFTYGTNKVRGVNIGGWLVLEPWITPSVFESTENDNIVDEFTLGQFLDEQTALTILNNHWSTWITEDDFAQISAAGLTHVRIPIGYWSIPLTASDTSTSTSTAPYVQGAWAYFLRALVWAKKHNVRVIVDLHGAPGSQNGYDNSGQRTGNPVWAVNPDNVTRTVDTLKFLAKEVGNQVDVIELLNEPAGFRGDDWAAAVRSFWEEAYDAVRQAAGEDVKIMIGDAFLGVNSWTNFLTPPQGQGVMMDFHEYQIFSDLELDRSFDDHINFACTYTQTLSSFSSSNLWTVVGEWSNAMTDCAKWLNGRGVGARWDGTWFNSGQVHGNCSDFTGSYSSWTAQYRENLRKYWEVQVEVGEAVQGWVFWTWKAENADEWSYQKGLEGGWIPQDPTNRKYPGICT